MFILKNCKYTMSLYSTHIFITLTLHQTTQSIIAHLLLLYNHCTQHTPFIHLFYITIITYIHLIIAILYKAPKILHIPQTLMLSTYQYIWCAFDMYLSNCYPMYIDQLISSQVFQTIDIFNLILYISLIFIKQPQNLFADITSKQRTCYKIKNMCYFILVLNHLSSLTYIQRNIFQFS